MDNFKIINISKGCSLEMENQCEYMYILNSWCGLVLKTKHTNPKRLEMDIEHNSLSQFQH